MANLSARERKATFGRTHIHVRRTTWDRVDYPLHPFVKSSRVPSCHVRARRPCVRRSASLIVHRLLVFAALTSAPWRLSLVSEASIRPRRQCDFVFGLRSIHGLHLITSQQHFSTFRSRSSPRPPTFSCSPSLHCCVHAVKNTTIPQGRKQYQIPPVRRGPTQRALCDFVCLSGSYLDLSRQRGSLVHHGTPTGRFGRPTN